MQPVVKSIFFALLVAVVARTASAAGCSAANDASQLPYSVKYTTTGDASSTTFIMTVCNTKCSSATADTCRPLKSVSVGATGVTAYPTASSDACGPSFGAGALGSLATAAPSGPENCEALYLTANKPSATLAEVCANGCPVLFTLDNGATYSTTVDGAAVPSPSPSSSPSGGSSPSSSSPKPYGPSPYRRRSLQEEAARGLFQQGRRLTQYGRRL